MYKVSKFMVDVWDVMDQVGKQDKEFKRIH